MIVALSQKEKMVKDAWVIEVMAAKRAIAFALKMRIQDVIVYSR